MDELVREFLTESNDGLSEVDSKLVELEKHPEDASLIADIFRKIHSIKGAAGFMGLERLNNVAHATENLLDQFRQGALVTSAHITSILMGIDAIRVIIAEIESNNGEELPGDDTSIITVLNKIADAIKAGSSDGSAEEIGRKPEQLQGVVSDPSEAAPGAVPPPAAVIVTTAPLAPSPAVPPAQVAPAPPAPPAPPVATGGPDHGADRDGSVRINVTLLNELMDLVGEMVLSRNQIQQVVKKLGLREIAAPVQNLSRVASELQDRVMKTRMQPIDNVFKTFVRTVRDLSTKLGKQIDLKRVGEDTEMDRQILELIRDPLTHMVRNCCDHALETPQERIAAGKNPTGTITLEAFHQGGYINIHITDDGRGISVDKVGKKALEKGLVTREQLEKMSPNHIRMMIFGAGFSTAEQVTDVSGRGVGMDVVRTNIEKIGGTISLDSTEGKGTTFTIRIPLTLAIVSAFIVEAGGCTFAVPQINVMLIVSLKQKNSAHRIETIDGRPMLIARDKIYPLISLASSLGLTEAGCEEHASEQTVLVVQVGDEVFGILVDAVVDTEEIVVKPLSRALQNLTVYTGNTILGDGSVIMILDPTGLLAMIGADSNGAHPPLAAEDVEANDDEEVVQMLIFTAGGTIKKGVHLGVVARLEEIDTHDFQINDSGEILVKYRDSLMPVICPGGWSVDLCAPAQKLIVFTDEGRSMGLAVEDINGIVDAQIKIDMRSSTPGVVGNALVQREAVEIIDVNHYIEQALGGWESKVRSGDRHISSFTVLMVDDSQFFRTMLTQMVAARGYTVIAAESAREALEIMEEQEVHVLISDIEMPGMDGYQFIEEVRKSDRYGSIPAVAVSAYASELDVKRGLNAGFNEYLPKMAKDNLFNFLRANTVDKARHKGSAV